MVLTLVGFAVLMDDPYVNQTIVNECGEGAVDLGLVGRPEMRDGSVHILSEGVSGHGRHREKAEDGLFQGHASII